MQERHGLGLRTQILLALSVVFALSFSFLGLVAVRLVERDARGADTERARAILHGVAVGMQAAESRELDARLGDLVGREGIVGLRVERAGRTPRTLGQTGDGLEATRVLEGGREVTLFMRPTASARSEPLGKLLRLYLFVTGAAVLLIGYVLLTRLIVRPVENLTRASERLARGVGSGEVPVGGAAEVVRLATAFNRMGIELAQEREALQQRLRELERTHFELRATQDHLIRSEKLASVGRLAAGVAHEIGNPLAAILGFVDLLRDADVAPAQQAEFLGRIGKETERIHHIIRDLLDYSRSAPEGDTTDETCDLASIVEEAVKLVAPQKDLRGVTVERRFAADIPTVRAPAHALTQVVLNLLLNAADAVGGEGAVLIEVEAAADEVCLCVSDTGPGVAPEVLSTLFDPFVTTKPPGQGTGLGLSVCQSLVERFGGRLAVDNPPEGGARFSVWLRATATGPGEASGADEGLQRNRDR